MSNGTKILIGILLIGVIVIGVSGAIKSTADKNENNKQNGELDEILDYIEKTENDDKQTNVENNVIENGAMENEVVENNVVENDVVGKEEEESNKENTEAQNRQKAIQMAKDEWAISVDSYDFQAELQDDETYIVKVINKTTRNEITRYTVNVVDETIEEV